jgi:hypothetical protein
MDEQRTAEIQCVTVLADIVYFTHTSMLIVLSAEDQDLIDKMMKDQDVELIMSFLTANAAAGPPRGTQIQMMSQGVSSLGFLRDSLHGMSCA